MENDCIAMTVNEKCRLTDDLSTDDVMEWFEIKEADPDSTMSQ